MNNASTAALTNTLEIPICYLLGLAVEDHIPNASSFIGAFFIVCAIAFLVADTEACCSACRSSKKGGGSSKGSGSGGSSGNSGSGGGSGDEGCDERILLMEKGHNQSSVEEIDWNAEWRKCMAVEEEVKLGEEAGRVVAHYEKSTSGKP